jgi:putative permease
LQNNRDTLKLCFLFLVLAFVFSVFFLTPALRPSALLTILNVLLLSPVIKFLERKKLAHTTSILLVFLIAGLVLSLSVGYATTVLASQWRSLSESLPIYGDQLIQKLNGFQSWLNDQVSFEINLGVTNWIKKIGNTTQDWLVTGFPSLLGDLASAFFLVPIFSFFLLRDGKKMKMQFFKLLPRKYHDSTIQVITKTSRALSEFVRAKVIEAVLVGLLAFIGLMSVNAPYAGIFALVIGITNIIPYLGPVLGAAIPLAIIGLSDPLSPHFWPALAVLLVVNAIDFLIIFPIFVAKLVNLNPLILLEAVAVGQQFYGLIGMLIAVPLASVIKIIFQELVHAMYGAEGELPSEALPKSFSPKQ